MSLDGLRQAGNNVRLASRLNFSRDMVATSPRCLQNKPKCIMMHKNRDRNLLTFPTPSAPPNPYPHPHIVTAVAFAYQVCQGWLQSSSSRANHSRNDAGAGMKVDRFWSISFDSASNSNRLFVHSPLRREIRAFAADTQHTPPATRRRQRCKKKKKKSRTTAPPLYSVRT